VTGFVSTPAGEVPVAATSLTRRERLRDVGAMLGLGRKNHKIVPGLYAVGEPGPGSPVLVSANYAMSFNVLRRELSGLDAWVLVIDTCGINVWCAAGKKLFSTREVARMAAWTRLASVVSHRELILPQLAAPGVAAHQVRRSCGFGVVYGPVRAADIPRFLEAGKRADRAMRSVTFTLGERFAVAPIELLNFGRPLAVAAAACFLISGIGDGIWSVSRAWDRGPDLFAALAAGTVAGTLVAPLVLGWLPGRSFWIKGAALGLAVGGAAAALLGSTPAGSAALVLAAAAASSHLTMNFTGSTPYTSPTGVEYEMRRGIPVQLACLCAAAVLWVLVPWIS
jgi:hypothetical protein